MKIGNFTFGSSKKQDIKQHQFSTTPLVDAMYAEYSGGFGSITKEEALSVPGVMKARNMICSLATLPMKTYKSDWTLVDSRFLNQIDPLRTDVVVMTDTFEDLFFYGCAYWRVLDRDPGNSNRPLSAEYIAVSRVSEEIHKGQVILRIDGVETDWYEVIKFESANPGMLKYGSRVVRSALDLDKTAAKYARNPMPLNYFRPMAEVDPIDDAGVRDFLNKWKNWLRHETTGYVPAGMEYVQVAQPTPQQLELAQMQQQVGLSIANMTGVLPEDLGISTTSRTYANIVDRRLDRINEVFAPYMRAITDRLSMDDVTPRGQQVTFDLDDYLKADPQTRANVEIAYKNAGVYDVPEIRAIERLAPKPVANESTLDSPPEPEGEPNGEI